MFSGRCGKVYRRVWRCLAESVGRLAEGVGKLWGRLAEGVGKISGGCWGDGVRTTFSGGSRRESEGRVGVGKGRVEGKSYKSGSATPTGEL